MDVPASRTGRKRLSHFECSSWWLVQHFCGGVPLLQGFSHDNSKGSVCPPLTVCSCSIGELSVSFLRKIPVEVFFPAPHASSGLLLQIDPDISETLRAEALRCFNPEDDMTEVGQFKYFRSSVVAYKIYKERDIISLKAAFSFRSDGRHLSHINDTEAKC
jgi:hypothetical protein